ncbi:MAG: CorA family divalent cation transporter [Sedimentibacter sp.]|uniref:CorA family divalent cation transporter n=1 Tax=Sedimentibacter sp. TaxID=1960295 RepID=UPI002980CDB6|nr:CorA family divalent cation transporter [Sedimentibacter sp.]MDW5300207.1 CorA family divalent cation transporter [Sedimentibacter sp.]
MLIYKINQDNLTETTFESFTNDEIGKYWILFNVDELCKKNAYFNFSHQSVNECIHNDDTPKLDIYENYNFGILNIIGTNQNLFSADELDFYMTKRYLVFVSKKNLNIFKEIKDDIYAKGTLNLGLENILYTLFDKLTAKDYNILSNLESEISNVEEDVIEGKIKDYITDIVSLKNKLLFLKKHYEPLLDIVEDLIKNENNILGEKSISHFVILFNRIERLNRKVGNLRDYATQIRESYQAQLEITTNNTMKLFTIISAVFLPLTFIVGWYGMNFIYMPELHWKFGYIFVMVLSVSVLVFCLWLFRKKKLW